MATLNIHKQAIKVQAATHIELWELLLLKWYAMIKVQAKYVTSTPFFGTWSGNLMVFIYKWHQKNGGLMQILVQGQFSSLEINWSPLTMDLIFNPLIIFLVVLIKTWWLYSICCIVVKFMLKVKKS